MKSTRKKWLQLITITIGVIAFIFILGQIGSLERNKITLSQAIIRSIIWTAILLASRITYWKIGQADEN